MMVGCPGLPEGERERHWAIIKVDAHPLGLPCVQSPTFLNNRQVQTPFDDNSMPAVAAHEYKLHFFGECVQQRASGLNAT
jgi:hypothetical protein